MRDKEIFSKAWCDLLFADRNRAYGAYVLRRDAGHRYAVALRVLAVIFLAFLALCAVAGLLVFREVKDAMEELNKLQKLERVKPLTNHEFHDMAQGQQAIPRMKPGASMSRPEIVEGIALTLELGVDGPEAVAVEEEDLSHLANDTLRSPDSALPLDGLHLSPTEVVEEMPRFPGGIGALMKWLDAHIIYTYASVRAKTEGDMEVTFVVDEDGRVCDPKVTRSLSPSLDRTALAAIRDMPRWEPARSNGRVTHVQVTLPIEFRLK